MCKNRDAKNLLTDKEYSFRSQTDLYGEWEIVRECCYCRVTEPDFLMNHPRSKRIGWRLDPNGENTRWVVRYDDDEE